MRLPAGLKKLDDRVLGSRGPGADGTRTPDRRSDSHEDVHPHDKEPSVEKTESTSESTTEPAAERTERTERKSKRAGKDSSEQSAKGGNGDGLPTVLATVWRISRLVFLALGLLLVIAIALILLPANEDNVIVRNVLSWAETVAGPFKDVFTADDPERMRIYNYGLAAAVYFVLATIVSKLPTGSKKKRG